MDTERNSGPKGLSWTWSSSTPLDGLTEEEILIRNQSKRFARKLCDELNIDKPKRWNISFNLSPFDESIVLYRITNWAYGKENLKSYGEASITPKALELLKKYFIREELLSELRAE